MKLYEGKIRILCVLIAIVFLMVLTVPFLFAKAEETNEGLAGSLPLETQPQETPSQESQPTEPVITESPQETPSKEPQPTEPVVTESPQEVPPSPAPSAPESMPQEIPGAGITEPPESAPIEYYQATDPLHVGPIIKPSEKKVRSLKAAALTTGSPTASYVAPAGSLKLNKTASVAGSMPDGRPMFKLNLTATTESNIVNNPVPCDIILVLDRSGSMSDNLGSYTAITTAPEWDGTYYVKVGGTYYQVYPWGSIWYYWKGSKTYCVTWSATGDDNAAGNKDSDHPTPKPFYTYNIGGTKLQALKSSANNFVQTVFTQSPQSRIAVVSFADGETNNTNGLVSVSQNGAVNTAITSAINGLSASGATHANEGMGLACDIFHADTSTNRNRVVVLFTDGEPGNNGFTDKAGSRYAAATINQSAVLKGTRDTAITSDVTFNGYKAGTSIDSPRTGNGAGCGATVYTIGVFPSNVNVLAHRYMAWVSSDNDSSQTATGSNGFNYYFTANSTDTLNAIFQSIAQETGEVLENVAVKDYIDTRFNAVDASGNAINLGGTITVDGVTGTLKSDTNGLYMEWTKARLEPGELSAGKGFATSMYVAPKPDFIGGNNIPTNIANISALYAGGSNLGSFPNPLVNVPFKLNVSAIEDTILLGETVPRDKATAQDDMIEQNIVDYTYPSGMLAYAWNPDYTAGTRPLSVTAYNLTVTAAPVDYISFADSSVWTPVTGGYKKNTGEVYYTAVGGSAVTAVKTAAYTVRPVQPQFTGSTYDIFLGENAGAAGATTLAGAIALSLPDNDISGAPIPPNVKTALSGRLLAYKGNLVFTVASITPSGSAAYSDPLSQYAPLKTATLNVTAKYGGAEVKSAIPVRINVAQGKLTIQKTVQGTPDANQTFVFEIKQYSNVNKTTLVRTFYETLRVSGTTASKDIINLSKGYYEVTEKSGWSWRYAANNTLDSDTLGIDQNGSRNIAKTTANTDFINVSTNHNWLSDIGWIINVFTGGDKN